MKKKLLLGSASLVGLATTLSLCNSIFVNDSELALRLIGISWSLGLGSVGLFFVGFIFPDDA